MNIEEAAHRLLEAEKMKQPIQPLTDLYTDITLSKAYHTQLAIIAEKVNAGAKIVGKKIGATSRAIQQMFGVTQPDYGHLLDDMLYVDGDTVPLDRYIQPKAEFEIAFVLKEDLVGPHVTVIDVVHSVDYIVPAMEIIDSRIENWNIKFEDTVADNGSAASAVIGNNFSKLDGIDLTHIGMAVYRNGELLATGTGAEVLGNPLHAVAWLANAIAKFGVTLKKGEIILAGALTKAVDIEDGDTYAVEFAHVGAVEATFKAKG